MIGVQPFRSVAEIRRATAKPAGNPDAAAFRRALGLTQKGMAERFGVSATSVHESEAGRRGVPLAIRQAMRAHAKPAG